MSGSLPPWFSNRVAGIEQDFYAPVRKRDGKIRRWTLIFKKALTLPGTRFLLRPFLAFG